MAATGTKPWAYWHCTDATCGWQSAGARDEKTGSVAKVCSYGDKCPATEVMSEVATYDDGRYEIGPDHVNAGGGAPGEPAAPEPAAPVASSGGTA